jgi:L,D-peptidoglycan transpeptidase YkuD (ErfK/YbiS/YcfS/YnhG family)
MDLIVEAKMGETRGTARLGARALSCALGRAGMVADKREGDGATPIGRFAFRRLLYRADRVPRIETLLPARHIERDDGWCDDPASPDYNRPVRLPHPARHEALWRADHLYDLVVVIGHNDNPVVKGAGSAIFLHVARDDFGPTAGCIAFTQEGLLWILSQVTPRDAIVTGGRKSEDGSRMIE